jgi:replicative DNA helicase
MRDVEALKRSVPASVLIATYLDGGLRQRGQDEYEGICPFHDDHNPSFQVYTDEKNHEWFKCQGCGEHGDIITFLKKIENCDDKKAIDLLEEFVKKHADNNGAEWKRQAGRVQSTFRDVAQEMKNTKRSIHVAAWNSYERALEACPAAIKFLKEERGVTLENAKKLHFGYVQSINGELKPEQEPFRNAGWICFPRIVGDKVVAVKYRNIAKKIFSQMAKMQEPSALFNVESISPFEPIFVVEGEFDCAIMEQHGFTSVSIPNSSTAISPEMKKRLKSAECVILAGDNDGKSGTLQMQKLYRELEDHRYLLIWPGVKDANEFFLKTCKGDADTFKKSVKALVDTAKATPIDGFTSLIERLRTARGVNAKNDPRRVHFPWADIDEMNYTPAGGIVVIYSTYSATGKTVFTSEFILSEAKRGEVVVVYSPELRDEQYLGLLAAQTIGSKEPGGIDRNEVSEEQLNRTANELIAQAESNGAEFKFYVGHELPVTDTQEVIKFLEEVVKVTGATRFVIDTIHRVVGAQGRETQTEAEGRVVKAIERIGIKYNCTFVLIGQSNKEAEGLKESNRDELGVLRGCREITDVAYAVYLLHRKRIKQENGSNDILELKCDVHLKKDRGRGPGASMVSLVYDKKTSTFKKWTGQQEPNARPPQPVPGKKVDFSAQAKKVLDKKSGTLYD